MKRRLPALVALLGCVVCGCGPSNDITLQGSGATFPAPLYKRWFLEYYKQHPEVRVNYTPIGSGAGIRQFTAGLVTFGASDAGINKDQIADLPGDYGGVFALPMTAGAIVLSYNVPGYQPPADHPDQPIRLSRKAYVNIFLNKITRWDDPAILEANPGAKLPPLRIVLVRRAESSGTTFAFTTHMSVAAKTVDPDSKDPWPPGVNQLPTWGASIAALGNDGVAALIQLTPGAIGYLEYEYANLAPLPMASLENHFHNYTTAKEDGAKALEKVDIPPDLQIRIPDPSGNEQAYPIVTYTWVLCRHVYHDKKEADNLKLVLRFCLAKEQQDIAEEQLGYIRLPDDVVQAALKNVEKINQPDQETRRTLENRDRIRVAP